MKVTINCECTPEEARSFLGLPDVAPLNEFLVEQTRASFEKNIHQMQPEELLKTWSGLGVQMQDNFLKLFQMSASAGMSGFPKK
ncbi:DUF6489 family protein [Asticcacaulis sp. ZE23SCel15]|uniref:DUF6489 family protein n=1 Tax=Asticcacaulis sp. ZE23SCel15 TaxID=3059027 RepID=UPI00265F4E56|nr:DUF6489 family protein [Asticcacaulis sp. ZE23SCel15]WKL58295.1 DUF6489 family protein [Asticcacaulis sp. ZE23SCel15]